MQVPFGYNPVIMLKGMFMKSASLLLLVLLLFGLSGCSKQGDREKNATTLPAGTQETEEGNISSHSFLLTDIDDRELNITIRGKEVETRDFDQPLLLLNFFATWCPPCRGELPDLSQLQRKHAKNLFIVGILVNDEQNSTQLRHFMEKYGANYFISYAKENDDVAAIIVKELNISKNFPIPLSVLYKDGVFYRYYEGAMPIEMMENELKQALKKPQ